MIDTEIDIIITSVPSGNGLNISLGDHFSYIASDHLDFAKILALTAPITGSCQEDIVVLWCWISQCWMLYTAI